MKQPSPSKPPSLPAENRRSRIEATRPVSDTFSYGSAWARISIVTPSYNQGQFLEETIRSVLGQGYPNLEYIIMDGGSTDGSIEIIRRYEPWLTYWVSEPDRGQSHALNKGLARASGKYLAWLNSDDVMGEGVLEQAATYLEQHSQTAAVYGNADFVDSAGRVISHYQTNSFQLPLFLYYDFIPQPTVVMRRECVAQVGGFDESLGFCLDHDLWLRLLRLGSIDYLPALYAKYRVHATSKSSTLQAQRWNETVKILEKFFGASDLPSEWYGWKEQSIGHAHWQASVEYAKLRETERAQEHVNRAMALAPEYLEQKDFAEMVVGRIASEVTREMPAFVTRYFELIPDVRAKRNAFRRARARANALLAINPTTGPEEARNYARSALKTDLDWATNRHVVRRALR